MESKIMLTNRFKFANIVRVASQKSERQERLIFEN